MIAENFSVSVKESDEPKRELDITITHNGFQFWTVSISVDEWPLIVEAVDNYLTAME